MTTLTIVGGVYHERSVWPSWDQIYGSGGRAAAALSGHVDSVLLRAYARPDYIKAFEPAVSAYGFTFEPSGAEQSISFDYIHSLSPPIIMPPLSRIQAHSAIIADGPAVLRFGMLEGTAVVNAEYCVYDPQSPLSPEPFESNGSSASHLAIVANRGEITALGAHGDPVEAARSLLNRAEVVVVKSGAAGAAVVERSGVTMVPAYQTDNVWTIGSGDVFAAVFAGYWATGRRSAADAAQLASRAVAAYANTMSLPIPPPEELLSAKWPEVRAQTGKVYLASPFFSLGERWVVDEARRCLFELGLDVFSPVHDVGAGSAAEIAPADLAALDDCDLVFAILDGLDSGTLFEIGYARARSKSIYALAQTVSEEDLKMVTGSGCSVFHDFVTALYHAAWRA